jgi:hypothetical protein
MRESEEWVHKSERAINGAHKRQEVIVYPVTPLSPLSPLSSPSDTIHVISFDWNKVLPFRLTIISSSTASEQSESLHSFSLSLSLSLFLPGGDFVSSKGQAFFLSPFSRGKEKTEKQQQDMAPNLAPSFDLNLSAYSSHQAPSTHEPTIYNDGQPPPIHYVAMIQSSFPLFSTQRHEQSRQSACNFCCWHLCS